VGEVAAAWACGALRLKDAVTVIHHRSRLQAKTRESSSNLKEESPYVKYLHGVDSFEN
jgi:acyl transferase domain-containing protein